MNVVQAITFLKENPSPMCASQEIQDQWVAVIGFFYRTPDVAAIPFLIQTFGDGDHMEIYTCIQVTLQQYGQEDVLPHLTAGLKSPTLGIRCWCADTLRYFPDPSVIPALSRLLRDPHPLARYEAAVALECIAHRSVGLVAAQALLRETDEDVRDVLRDLVAVA